MPSRPKVVLRFEQGSVGSASWVSIANCCSWISRFPAADLPVWWLSYIGRMCSNSSFGEGWPTSSGSWKQHWELTLAPFWILEASLPAKCFSKIRIDLDTNPQGNGLTLRAEGLYALYIYAFCMLLWYFVDIRTVVLRSKIYGVYMHLSLRICVYYVYTYLGYVYIYI